MGRTRKNSGPNPRSFRSWVRGTLGMRQVGPLVDETLAMCLDPSQFVPHVFSAEVSYPVPLLPCHVSVDSYHRLLWPDLVNAIRVPTRLPMPNARYLRWASLLSHRRFESARLTISSPISRLPCPVSAPSRHLRSVGHRLLMDVPLP